MLTAKAMVFCFISGTAAAGLASVLTLEADHLQVAERYVLLALHVIVVLGLGSGMLVVGWNQVRATKNLEGALLMISDRMETSHLSEDIKRKEFSDAVVNEINSLKSTVLAAVGEIGKP